MTNSTPIQIGGRPIRTVHLCFNYITRKLTHLIDVDAKTAISAAVGSPLSQIVKSMERGTIKVDRLGFAELVEECGKAKSLKEGKCVHAHIIQSGLQNDRYLSNLLVNMYGKCGRLDEARTVFDNLSTRRVVSWNVMIAAYARNGRRKLAVNMFEEMQRAGLTPAKATLITVLKACSKKEDLAAGETIHSRIRELGFEKDVAVGTALVKMYGKCGNVEFASQVFHQISHKNVLSWNSMIEAYALEMRNDDALQLFKRMQSSGVIPDKSTFIIALGVCGDPSALGHGKHIHYSIVDNGGYEQNVEMSNALIKMYGRCGSLEDARRVFDKMRERDGVSWNAMIAASSQLGDETGAIGLLRQKKIEGFELEKINFVSILHACSSSPSALLHGKLLHGEIVAEGLEVDLVVGTALVHMYGKCGDVEQAERIFAKFSKGDVELWNVMIAAYARNAREVDALKLFKQMQFQGFNPNRTTFITLLHACSRLKSAAEGQAAHAQLLEYGYESDVVIGTALINMYGKLGCILEAKSVFQRMPEQNAYSWTAMIGAYVEQGLLKQALHCFQQMKASSVEPTKVTLVTMLNVYSSPNVLEEGRMIHRQIIEMGFEDDIVVGNVLVNMYERCESLKDAQRIFDRMPVRDLISWNSLIGAYVHSGDDAKKAFQLFRQMQQEGFDPDRVTYLELLDACDNPKYLEEGTLIHASIVDDRIQPDVILDNALIHMYGKCGSLEEARNVFDKILMRDVVSWNSMISEYADHGHGIEAFELFGQMHLEGLLSNRVTLVSILAACSHGGLVEEGCHYFSSMLQNSDIKPTLEHFGCMIDLHARAGKLEEAEVLIREMPFESDHIVWMSMLRACKTHDDIERGNRMAHRLLELDPQGEAIYAMLGNIYAAAEHWDDATMMRKAMRRSMLT